MRLGAHIGTSDGLDKVPSIARSIGGEAAQIFSKSPHSWRGPPIPLELAASFREAVQREKLGATAIHHCYLTNLASPKPVNYAISKRTFLDELGRAELLGVDAVIFHPGAHTGSGVEAGIDRIAEALRWAVDQTPQGTVRILLENAAGQGSTIGSQFEELAQVIEKVNAPGRLGIAVDLCHLFASGVDFRTEETYGAAKDLLRGSVGLKAVGAFHLNDSKGELGSHLDRHQNVGKGQIGLEGFRPWLNDRSWAKVPGYLETPLTDDGYAAYIEDLRALKGLLA
ncbi:MAG: deoxyribonuclease IV [Thermoplasmata archaeon]|nr:deoxyribonuclease IV [Thermoplasmata archaeon]MCI4338473.1 deoxyribonuclease IV [Thermoplasmata archaeon]MCI4340797.1 deoxyribonuclease IV [Thermoplasmata archaeon]